LSGFHFDSVEVFWEAGYGGGWKLIGRCSNGTIEELETGRGNTYDSCLYDGHKHISYFPHYPDYSPKRARVLIMFNKAGKLKGVKANKVDPE